jgi:hypothetical protein
MTVTDEIKAHLHLIRCFADEIHERNYGDKKLYIKQQVDRIEAALSLAPQVKETAPPSQLVVPQPWKERENFTFDLDDEMVDRLETLAERCQKQGVGILASANYHGQGQVNVPAAWLLQLIAGYRTPPPETNVAVFATVELDPEVVSFIAHQITGAIGGTCCHRTGGRDPKAAHCECRDAAERILEECPQVANVVRAALATTEGSTDG